MITTKWKKLLPVFIVLIVALSALIYLVIITQQGDDGVLSASGTVETVEVKIAPEFGGKVIQVFVEQGQSVAAGQELIALDDTLYQAQRERATAAHHLALANLEAAQAAENTALATLDAATAQYDVIVNNARFQELSMRLGLWSQDKAEEISLPVWYFNKSESIAAAEMEVQSARQDLLTEEENFSRQVSGISGSAFVEAEVLLAESQAAFTVAQAVFERAKLQKDEDILQAAQGNYDSALAELESIQIQYDQLLTDLSSQEIIEARARLSVAKERYETALDYHSQLLTGEDALAVKSALSAVEQAEAAMGQAGVTITQAQSALEQTEAEIALIDVQLSRLILYAPSDGVVMTRNIEAGEIAKPGASLMTIGKLDQLTITVFIAEDRYGEIFLGQGARVTVDAFPKDIFDGIVIHIADQAEYTPRNVQTEEGRRTTVFAIKLAMSDQQGKLKPGMPADVVFSD